MKITPRFLLMSLSHAAGLLVMAYGLYTGSHLVFLGGALWIVLGFDPPRQDEKSWKITWRPE